MAEDEVVIAVATADEARPMVDAVAAVTVLPVEAVEATAAVIVLAHLDTVHTSRMSGCLEEASRTTRRW